MAAVEMLSYFPIQNLQDLIDIFRRQLFNPDGPNISILSIILGFYESQLSFFDRISSSDQEYSNPPKSRVSPHKSIGGKKLAYYLEKNREKGGIPKLQVSELESVLLPTLTWEIFSNLFSQFETLIREGCSKSNLTVDLSKNNECCQISPGATVPHSSVERSLRTPIDDSASGTPHHTLQAVPHCIFESIRASRYFIKRISDLIWSTLDHKTPTITSKSQLSQNIESRLDKSHIHSIYSYLVGKRLDSLGVALTVVAASQLLGYPDVHLALSEDHAWVTFCDDETAEVTWQGRGNEDKRGLPITFGVHENSWLYLSGNSVICDRLMEISAIVSSMSPSTSDGHHDCVEIILIQQALLWILYDLTHLDRYPMGLACLADVQELCCLPDRPSAELLYHRSIQSNVIYYDNAHVYPYIYLAAHYQRKSNYLLTFWAWAEAAHVVKRYTYNREDEEIYKEFFLIANEILPSYVKNEISRLDDLSSTNRIKQKNLTLVSNDNGSAKTSEDILSHRTQQYNDHSYLHDPAAFKQLLRFYDGICLWEEGSSTPVLHCGWTRPFIYAFSRFSPLARSHVKVTNLPKSDEEGEDDVEGDDENADQTRPNNIQKDEDSKPDDVMSVENDTTGEDGDNKPLAKDTAIPLSSSLIKTLSDSTSHHAKDSNLIPPPKINSTLNSIVIESLHNVGSVIVDLAEDDNETRLSNNQLINKIVVNGGDVDNKKESTELKTNATPLPKAHGDDAPANVITASDNDDDIPSIVSSTVVATSSKSAASSIIQGKIEKETDDSRSKLSERTSRIKSTSRLQRRRSSSADPDNVKMTSSNATSHKSHEDVISHLTMNRSVGIGTRRRSSSMSTMQENKKVSSTSFPSIGYLSPFDGVSAGAEQTKIISPIVKVLMNSCGDHLLNRHWLFDSIDVPFEEMTRDANGEAEATVKKKWRQFEDSGRMVGDIVGDNFLPNLIVNSSCPPHSSVTSVSPKNITVSSKSSSELLTNSTSDGSMMMNQNHTASSSSHATATYSDYSYATVDISEHDVHDDNYCPTDPFSPATTLDAKWFADKQAKISRQRLHDAEEFRLNLPKSAIIREDLNNADMKNSNHHPQVIFVEVELWSVKMREIAPLLTTAERLNSGAIELQLTAQSQVTPSHHSPVIFPSHRQHHRSRRVSGGGGLQPQQQSHSSQSPSLSCEVGASDDGGYGVTSHHGRHPSSTSRSGKHSRSAGSGGSLEGESRSRSSSGANSPASSSVTRQQNRRKRSTMSQQQQPRRHCGSPRIVSTKKISDTVTTNVSSLPPQSKSQSRQLTHSNDTFSNRTSHPLQTSSIMSGEDHNSERHEKVCDSDGIQKKFSDIDNRTLTVSSPVLLDKNEMVLSSEKITADDSTKIKIGHFDDDNKRERDENANYNDNNNVVEKETFADDVGTKDDIGDSIAKRLRRH